MDIRLYLLYKIKIKTDLDLENTLGGLFVRNLPF